MSRTLVRRALLWGILALLAIRVDVGSQAPPGTSGWGPRWTKRDSVIARARPLAEMRRGDSVTVHLAADTLRGTFVTLSYFRRSEYEARYASWADTAALAAELTALDGPVVVETRKGESIPGRFRGFTLGHLAVQQQGRASPSEIPFDAVSFLVDSAGRKASSAWLASLDSAGAVPSCTVIVLAVKGDTLQVPADAVRGVEYQGMGYPRGLLILLPSALDVPWVQSHLSGTSCNPRKAWGFDPLRCGR